jgi:hypothetical protein
MHVSPDVTISGRRKSNANAISLPVKLAHSEPPVGISVKSFRKPGTLGFLKRSPSGEHVVNPECPPEGGRYKSG